MTTLTRARWLAPIAAAIALGLSACGGSDSDEAAPDTPPPPAPQQPAPPPKFTYTPDPQVCAWMQAKVPPFQWPADRVGPRNWPEVAPVVTYAHPERDAQGTPLYILTSSEWVLTERYRPQAQALNVYVSPTDFWAQQVACDHGITIKSTALATLQAYMADDVAARIAREPYAAKLSLIDRCAIGGTFSGMPPPELPPECHAPTE